MKRSEFKAGMEVQMYEPVVDETIYGIVQNVNESSVDIKWYSDIGSCIYLDEELDDIKISKKDVKLTNLDIFKSLIEFYEKDKSLDIKDNFYAFRLLDYMGFDSRNLDFVKRTIKIVMLFRVSILEEYDIAATVMGKFS